MTDYTIRFHWPDNGEEAKMTFEGYEAFEKARDSAKILRSRGAATAILTNNRNNADYWPEMKARAFADKLNHDLAGGSVEFYAVRVYGPRYGSAGYAVASGHEEVIYLIDA